MLGDLNVRSLAIELADEAVAVARAEGVALTEERARSILEWMGTLSPGATTSMLQDRQAGRPLEHEALLGPVVILGVKRGIPTPTTRTILALLHALPLVAEPVSCLSKISL
ncbi:hypothetical protein MOQ72_36760 [Saccharopolyspora sp. K220]|nr:hypothetical protein [Saccharopolyspora soli]